MLPPFFIEEPERPNHAEITANLRNIRVDLMRVLQRSERFDGNQRNQSTVAVLMRQVMTMASRCGLSQEEAMTVLAYEALRAVERVNDQMLEFHQVMMPTSIILARGGLQESNAMQPGR